MAQKTISHSHSKRIATLIAITAAAFMVTACGDGDELAKATAERAQALQAASDTASHNKVLAAGKLKAEQALAAEQAKADKLASDLAAEKKLRHQTEIKLAHMTDQVKGAKSVAGTAVDHAHAKGVQVGKAANAIKPAKKAS